MQSLNEGARADQLTGGQALAGQLVAEGVEVIFGLPGDQLMTALDAFVDRPELRYIVTRHEQATTYMADGYARTSGRPGVAMVVPGVGVYNAATGLATAYACSSPVLLLAGQVNRAGIGRELGLLHDVHDQLEIVRPITKWARRITDPADVAAGVGEAFTRMTSGRPRPVEVEIPPETFAEKTTAGVVDPVRVPRAAAEDAQLTAAAAALRTASAPVVVAGGGVVLGDATAALTRVAELLQAPVVTTREGKGAIDDRHPLSVGTAWVNPRMRPVLGAADVVLAVGTRGAGLGLRDGQRLIHLDVDAEQIGRNHPAAVAVAGDAALTLEKLAEQLDQRPDGTAETRAMRATAEERLAAVGPQWEMVRALRRGIPEDGILVCDTTSVAYMCHMGYPVYAPRTYLSTSYMGTLGFGYPASLGVKVAAPDAPVVTVTGDGGFLFGSNELATAVQHGIHTVTVVFDDGAYGNSNRDQRDRFGGREYGTALRNPDWVALARAFGADGMVVNDIARLPAALTEALATEGSTVIAVPMDRLPSPF
ncbi:thiamine pyrophosphate-dependent enzyme [Cryptosporangium aurantiacum]|uniref:Acetolactate synthase-1/2/3 large subunit n=1 Tax=Cryptosporangium aurantiacum TaxID=134849 RepID=A0A1M7RJT6_9ACTN|nr:thiamine pyrophosphate-dependent enzyme [Cryptosporangium aurantiacum]SHN46573.1 acetolactate synthase-1/2/3 large subunit [Cryptosporangium aurantiacum]